MSRNFGIHRHLSPSPAKPPLGFFFAVTIGLLVELVVCVIIVALYILA